MSVKGIFTVFIAVIVTFGAYMALAMQASSSQGDKLLPPAYFYDKSGAKVSVDDFQGKVVLVNLWATWCPPCVEELPALAQLQASLSDKPFKVVAISFDRLPSAQVEAFLHKHKAQALKVYVDTDKDVARSWEYRGLPTSYLLNAKGEVVKVYMGGRQWSTDKRILKQINSLF